MKTTKTIKRKLPLVAPEDHNFQEKQSLQTVSESAENPQEQKQQVLTTEQATVETRQQPIRIQLNGFRIDGRIKELTLESTLTHNRLIALTRSDSINIDSATILYTSLVNLQQKIAKWVEIKSIYELNIKVNIFDKEMTLMEVREAGKLLREKIECLNEMTDIISTSVTDKLVNLQQSFLLLRKQERLVAYYEDATAIGKSQPGTFELDSSLFDNN